MRQIPHDTPLLFTENIWVIIMVSNKRWLFLHYWAKVISEIKVGRASDIDGISLIEEH